MRKINFVVWIMFFACVSLLFFFIYQVAVENLDFAKIWFCNKKICDIKNILNENKHYSCSEIIKPSTKIIYNYYYEDEGFCESTNEMAPQFLIGMNAEELKNTFANSDWKINNFSGLEVVLQKNISKSEKQNYVIGIKNGYVAVFYHENKLCALNLKEVTNTPVNSLSPEEQERLKNGIKISGNDNLLLVMQDYES